MDKYYCDIMVLKEFSPSSAYKYTQYTTSHLHIIYITL